MRACRRVCKCFKRTEVRATALAGIRGGKSRVFATVRARSDQVVKARGHKELASLCVLCVCVVVSTVLAKITFDTSAVSPPLLKRPTYVPEARRRTHPCRNGGHRAWTGTRHN